MKNKAQIIYQNFGSSIQLFITGNTARDAYEKWLSLANWSATSLLEGGEPKFVADRTISCWSTIAQLKKYFFNIRENELAKENPSGRIDGIKGSIKAKALELAESDFAAVPTESFRSTNGDFQCYEFGVLEASKPDENFIEQCYRQAFAN